MTKFDRLTHEALDHTETRTVVAKFEEAFVVKGHTPSRIERLRKIIRIAEAHSALCVMPEGKRYIEMLRNQLAEEVYRQRNLPDNDSA